jgi:hypothetical protein
LSGDDLGPERLRFPDIAKRIGATSVRLASQGYLDDPDLCDWHVMVEFEGKDRMYMLEIQRAGRLDTLPPPLVVETGAIAASEHLLAMEKRAHA